jgi:predicted alpha/beta hydrolase family esterase
MTTLLLPGLGGSGEGHWQDYWRDALPDARFVEQRNWDKPDLDDWIAVVAAAVIANPNATLVGHSLGAILIAHLAARMPDLPIAGALLVAPADVEESRKSLALIRGFGPLPLAPIPYRSILVASRNDAYMRFERAKVLASVWESQFLDLGHAGHINVASGYGPWEEGRLLVDRVSGRRTKPFLIAQRDDITPKAPLASPFHVGSR